LTNSHEAQAMTLTYGCANAPPRLAVGVILASSSVDVATLKKKANLAGRYSMKIPEQARVRHDLHERIKELTALYKALQVVQDSAKSSSEVLQDIVGLLPPAWQYPEITAARILFKGREFVTLNFRATPWSQSAPIKTTAGQNGTIEVVYLEAKPPEVEGPFLAEERDLISSLAGSVSSYLNHKQVETAFRQTHERLQALSPSLMPLHGQEQRSKQLVRKYLHHGGSKSIGGQELTPRQREILQLIAEGHSTKDMAQRLAVSVKTIETHRMDIKHRLGIHDVAGLVRYAIRVGLITPDS
jgi:DNA-binding CsgD family transcriptional regulator